MFAEMTTKDQWRQAYRLLDDEQARDEEYSRLSEKAPDCIAAANFMNLCLNDAILILVKIGNFRPDLLDKKDMEALVKMQDARDLYESLTQK